MSRVGKAMPKTEPNARSPSDLVRGAPRRVKVLVGGRVVRRDANRLLLADALGAIWTEVEEAAQCAPGDLVEVSGVWNGDVLASARLVGLVRAPESPGTGEFARLAFRGVGARLVKRDLALQTVRRYFASQRFVEVTTPVRVRTPGLDANVNALRAPPGWLTTSPEFHMKRLLVGGMPRIFQLTPCFRADEAGRLHEPEFTMLEWYRAFSDYSAVMRDTEQLVARVVRAIAGTTTLRVGSRRVRVTPPFRRLTVRSAFRRYAGIKDAVVLAATDEARFFELLVERVEPALAQQSRPVFLTHYPSSQAALARPCPTDPSVAERFELYLGGIELCNGFGELTDPAEQRRRFREEQRARRRARAPVYPLDQRFLAALDEGMPRASGNALGFERLVMLALEAESIRETMAFPEERR